MIHLNATTRITVCLFVMRVEQCILLISCPDLLHGLVQLGLVNIELHVGSVVLQILSLEAQIEGTLDPSGAAGDDLGIGEGHGLGNVPLAFVEEILISEAWVGVRDGVGGQDGRSEKNKHITCWEKIPKITGANDRDTAVEQSISIV